MEFSWVLLVVAVAYVNASYHQEKGPRCYDCNYAPSGYVLSKTGYSSGRVGYKSCALLSADDRDSVDKWGCQSGACFIRRDRNGLVYRGCADDKNLPWGVNSSAQCQYQGHEQALWWFCHGDLCNQGQLGDNPAMCGSPAPIPSRPAPKPMPVEQYKPSQQSRGKQPMTHNVYPAPKSQNNEGYGAQRPVVNMGYQESQGYAQQQQQHQGYGSESSEENSSEEDGKYLQISFGVNEVQGSGFGFLMSMCNGDCSHNPTGLYPFPGDASRFIQCAADNFGDDGYGGQTSGCTCCKPTALRCPEGTLYDDSVKVCVNSQSNSYGQNSFYNY